MGKINILDIETSNKIAAGEVVERPSSVVKELVENSIDAGALNISIEIEDGGENLIRVIDDGSGIYKDDVEKAFMPHATSKIRNIDDIFNISTLGFRGEALASIASVSRTTLKTRTIDSDLGKEICLEGSNLKHIIDVGCNVGTTIEVRNLFFNVPARKKFLKSSSRESAMISDIISRIAIANPKVAFKLFNNGKRVINTYGTGKLEDVVRTIYGKTISENITYFETHDDIATVHGYIGNSEISRGSRNNQSIFVNNRYIKNKLITAAVENAFKSFITINKFPYFIIFIDIFPEFVDVNIHPTKSEIKFKDDRLIFKLVFDAVHQALRESLKDSFMIPEEKDSNLFKPNTQYENLSYFDNNAIIKKTDNEKSYDTIYKDLENKKTESSGFNKDEDNKILEDHKNEFLKESKTEVVLPIDLSIQHDNRVEKQDTLKEQNSEYDIKREAKFPKLNIIGQFNKTYILAEYIDNLYIIDQHAAHEKILFQKYRNDIKTSKVVAQALLVPLVLEMNVEDYFYYIENKDVFSKSGFIIEDFGDNTISIREVPYVIGKLDAKNIFLNMLDDLKNLGTGKTEDIKYDRIATMACKAAIKANDALDILEMNNLIEELRYIEDPFTCPHGRPTIIKITLYELEKRFKRVQ